MARKGKITYMRMCVCVCVCACWCTYVRKYGSIYVLGTYLSVYVYSAKLHVFTPRKPAFSMLAVEILTVKRARFTVAADQYQQKEQSADSQGPVTINWYRTASRKKWVHSSEWRQWWAAASHWSSDTGGGMICCISSNGTVLWMTSVTPCTLVHGHRPC